MKNNHEDKSVLVVFDPYYPPTEHYFVIIPADFAWRLGEAECTVCLTDTLFGWLWSWRKLWEGSRVRHTVPLSAWWAVAGEADEQGGQGGATLEDNPVWCAEEQKSWFANLATASKRPWKWHSRQTVCCTRKHRPTSSVLLGQVCAPTNWCTVLHWPSPSHRETAYRGRKRNLKKSLTLLNLIDNKQNGEEFGQFYSVYLLLYGQANNIMATGAPLALEKQTQNQPSAVPYAQQSHV